MAAVNKGNILSKAWFHVDFGDYLTGLERNT